MAERVVVVSPGGLMLVDEKGEILSERPWRGDLKEILKGLLKGEVLEEERDFVSSTNPTATTSPRLSCALGLPLYRNLTIPKEIWAGEGVRRALIELCRERSRELWLKDGAIMMASGTLKDLQKATNLLKERLLNWAQGYLPGDIVVNEDEIVRIVTEEGEWMGGPSGEELKTLRRLGEEVKRLEDFEKDLKEFIKLEMERACPNLSKVATPVLGAQLITLAGGLERLSRFPSSTIQLLGAERGFFRYLMAGGKPPKHGAIFQHPLLHSAKPWNRGRVARALSGKITIAARIDAAGGPEVGEKLLKDLQRRVEEIERVHPSPPQREMKRSGRKKGRRRRS